MIVIVSKYRGIKDTLLTVDNSSTYVKNQKDSVKRIDIRMLLLRKMFQNNTRILHKGVDFL